MNKIEFDAWTRETKFSENAWVLDTIRYANTGDLLFYKGGTDGVYVWIQIDGVVSVGTYAYAIPHIGEALFIPKHTNQVANTQEEAFIKIAERLGVQMLIDLASSRAL